ncbi:MAG: UDP-2,4-diacetamido-2,4,6-trideoxy-beta-L-altropyranose hydrolase [Bacteroidetes bacterium]|nr:MAG: UDP-2,4-diacetamido-2,4,6-trideoxy-beta-L-altropyranose hydrolase [Bacteroidota bacterium]
MPNFMQHIVFRCDGNSNIGLGHIYRCLAAAEMLTHHFTCILVTKQVPIYLVSHITSVCKHIELTEEDEFEQLKKLLSTNSIVVLDGYHFDETYQTNIKAIANKLLLITDFENPNHSADVIINHGCMNENAYKGTLKPEATSYVGFKHLIIRKTFLDLAKQRYLAPQDNSLFICMGGADPHNLTELVLGAALNCNFISSIDVVIGAAYTQKNRLEHFIHLSGKQDIINLNQNISGHEMAKCIGRSKMAICTSSSIALEACCVKTGLITGYMIDNQQAIHEQLVHEGCCLSIGDFRQVTPSVLEDALNSLNQTSTLEKIILNQSRVFDGLSGERILTIFNQLFDEQLA